MTPGQYGLGVVLLLATALGEEQQQQQQRQVLLGPDWAEKMFQDPHSLSPLGEKSGRLGMFSADQEVFQTAVRPLIPDVEAKSCLTSLARDHSPFSERVTKKHIPKQYNLLDRRFYHKGDDIPYNYKTPCFDTCALVGSSGVLKNSKWGRVIDTHQAVFRLNNAPTFKHESDVGRRTTVRIMHDGHIAERNIAEMLRMDPGGMALVWPAHPKPKGLGGPSPKPDKTKHLGFWLDYANATMLLTRFSASGFYSSHMMARKVVAPWPPHVPSTGWNAMFAAIGMCRELHVFGYAWELSPETWRRAGHTSIGKAYYWYKHSKGDVTEHDYYHNRSIKNPNSQHRFAEEKQGYRNLAKIYNITFH